MVGLLVEQGSLIPEVVAVAVVDKVLHQEAVVVQVVLALLYYAIPQFIT
jgi:hypothetical protein